MASADNEHNAKNLGNVLREISAPLAPNVGGRLERPFFIMAERTGDRELPQMGHLKLISNTNKWKTFEGVMGFKRLFQER